ncbi:MAG: hypothetical protein RL757_1885 [Bacteroidota bacterium]|jgi:exopolyphosphatase/guanosine-5'-triphosphate,3'-diphosphate pyrophosphatase
MKKQAVIDLGTNGFRLQIAAQNAAGKLEIVYKKNFELLLAADGLHRIGAAPFARGLAAMQSFADILATHEVENTLAIGTAMLRRAENGAEFIETVRQKTGIQIELISGDREAALIYKGMKMGLPHTIYEHNLPVLMIDVGGGSVEFIVGTPEKMWWAKSFEVGVAVLRQRFQPTDIITDQQIGDIYQFLNHELRPVVQAIEDFRPQNWAMASGTTDLFVHMLTGNQPVHYPMLLDDFYRFYNDLIYKTPEEIVGEGKIPPEKADMMAVTLVLTDFIAQLFPASPFFHVSRFSMKMGALGEMAGLV